MEFIDLTLRMEADELLKVALNKSSACGPAAVAAVVAAAKAIGRHCGTLLGHTTSNDVPSLFLSASWLLYEIHKRFQPSSQGEPPLGLNIKFFS
jgi:hypothetical protein